MDDQEMMIRQVFAARLKLLRKERKMTMAQLTSEIGLTNGAISQYEHCKRSAQPVILARLSKLFGVTIDWLLGQSNERK
jgi:transcriptional regulator with XRE-family HTH domain